MNRRLWLLTLAVASIGLPLAADSYLPPFSYTKSVADGKYVFAMLSRWPITRGEAKASDRQEAEDPETRRIYKRSGLYRSGVPDDPLWTVDWYAYHVEVAPDGIHLVRPGGMFGASLDSEAVTFFANGKPLRTYTVRELIDDPSNLGRSVTSLIWMEEAQFDDVNLEYTLTTLDGNRFVFDVRTGKILSQRRWGLVTRWGGWAVLGGLALPLVVWLIWRWRKRGHQALTPAAPSGAPGTAPTPSGTTPPADRGGGAPP